MKIDRYAMTYSRWLEHQDSLMCLDKDVTKLEIRLIEAEKMLSAAASQGTLWQWLKDDIDIFLKGDK